MICPCVGQGIVTTETGGANLGLFRPFQGRWRVQLMFIFSLSTIVEHSVPNGHLFKHHVVKL